MFNFYLYYNFYLCYSLAQNLSMTIADIFFSLLIQGFFLLQV